MKKKNPWGQSMGSQSQSDTSERLSLSLFHPGKLAI